MTVKKIYSEPVGLDRPEPAADADGGGILPLLLLHRQPQLPGRPLARGHQEGNQPQELLLIQPGWII